MFIISNTTLILNRVRGVVEGVVEAAALLAGHGVAHDEVADVDEVAELADFRIQDGLLVEFLGLAVEDLETVEGALQTQVGTHDADIAAHDGLQLLALLRDEHHLLVEDGAFAVPVGHVVADLDARQVFDSPDTGTVREDQSFEQGIGRQTVGTVQTRRSALAGSVEVADGGRPPLVGLDAAAGVVLHRHHGNHLLGDVDADTQAFGVDVGKMLENLLLRDGGGVEDKK